MFSFTIWGRSLQGDGVVNHWITDIFGLMFQWKMISLMICGVWDDKTHVVHFECSCCHNPSGLWWQKVRVCVNGGIFGCHLPPSFVRIIITVQMHHSSEQCDWIGWFSQTCKTDDMIWAEFNGQSISSRRCEPFGSNLMMMAIALLTVAKRWVTLISMLTVFCLRVNHWLTWRGLNNDIEHGEQSIDVQSFGIGWMYSIAPYNELSL